MARLSNDFSWSVSRAGLFRECERAYYYNYYGSWGGWEAEAPERTRLLYLLKNLKTLPMWAGSIVHETIGEALQRLARTGQAMSLEELQARARTRLRSGWLEAVSGEWRTRPKKTNLQELYYGNGRSLPREITDSTKERVNTCLAAFAESAVRREIEATPYLQWKPIDTLDTFSIDDLKVWCAIDFAYTDAAGAVRVIDWKTGSEDRESLTTQLACYALYAAEKWFASLDRLRLCGVFLGDQARVSDYPVQPEMLVNTKDLILTSAEAMRSRLDDVAANQASEERFPFCENERVCRRCNFRQACPYVNAAPPAAP